MVITVINRKRHTLAGQKAIGQYRANYKRF